MIQLGMNIWGNYRKKIATWYRSVRYEKKYNHYFFLFILFGALCLRVPGLSVPYHQDEYKWAFIVAPQSELAGQIPHPPLSELIYVVADRIFGNEHLRFTPLVFFCLVLFFVYKTVQYMFDRRTAFFACILYSISFFSILASLMIDTDGQILPLYFITSLYCYIRMSDATLPREKTKWFAGFFVIVLCGMFTKLSFIIPVVVFLSLFLYQKRKYIFLLIHKKFFFRIFMLVCVVVTGGMWYSLYTFSIDFNFLKYVVGLSGRNYTQILVQVMKASFFLSPLLCLTPFFIFTQTKKQRKSFFQDTQPFLMYIFFGLCFYLICFDFSEAALDRYLQFLILPSCVLSAYIFNLILKKGVNIGFDVPALFTGIAASLLLVLTQFFPHSVPPLHPKSDWISRIFYFDWNFLLPFTGGSGPIGFYVSWLYIACAWILVCVCFVFALKKKQYTKQLLLVATCVGVFYNGIFLIEYQKGFMWGSAPNLLRESIQFIQNNNRIREVVSYNDIATYELTRMGKFKKRLYVDPQFDQ